LQEIIRALYEDGAYHIKRGFKINDATLPGIATHFVEEAVEVLDGVIHYKDGDKSAITEELADVILLMAHLTMRLGIPFQHIINVAEAKLGRNWTNDPKWITAKERGFTRRGRA
jgi:NTP pyrophosphatase (non-canonical NTP hydrolase)